MFMDMLEKHLPKSLRAGATLFVMVAAITIAFNALSEVLVEPTPGDWLRFIGGLTVGLPTAVMFYVFQVKDGRPKSPDQVLMETLAQAGARKPEAATPAYPELHAEALGRPRRTTDTDSDTKPKPGDPTV